MSLNVDKILNLALPPLTDSYIAADAVKYARGIGAGLPRGPDEKAFVSDAGPQTPVFPTFAATLNQGPMWTQNPELHLDWKQTVHLAERLKVLRPLKAADTLTARYRIDGVFDRGEGKGAQIQETRSLFNQAGELQAELGVTTLLRGNGGFGGAKPPPRAPAVPDKAPDASVDLPTPRDDEFAIYKLPSEFLAQADRSKGALLRGVCSFGIAGRGVLALACGGRPERFRELSLVYTGLIHTDELLRLELWHLERGKAAFRVRAPQRDAVVLDAGVFIFDPEG